MSRPSTPRILLTGATGQVGSELLQTLSSLSQVIAPTHSEMDLTNPASIRSLIRTVKPRWIVNPAAYTAVDQAETESGLAYAINTDAVKTIGEEARTLGAAVLHFSTDYVFDGTSATPYAETDATNPVSVYGASKLAGEKALAEAGAAHLIFRTSWVYGGSGRNFLLTILKLARERDLLKIVADQHGSPTWSRDLANMTANIIATCEAGSEGRNLSEVIAEKGGIYHAAGTGETTWHGFAAAAIQLLQASNPDLHLAGVQPISTAEYPTPAKRPANSRMNCTRLSHQFGWTMMHWQDSLREVMAGLSSPR